MQDALIGFSGFVGGTLLKQKNFDALYRSTNMHTIDGEEFDIVVSAGARAKKWIANSAPEADRQNIEALIAHLRTIKCNTFILISTVDVFKNPVQVDEYAVVEEIGLHPYGLHRRMLEKFVMEHFHHSLIVRLPGLVGPGLQKNVIFDLLNHNNLGAIDSRGVFQFYPMVNLWYDIRIALQAKLQLVHLAAAPINVSDLALQGFDRLFMQELAGEPARYDIQTRYAPLFGVQGKYQYGVREVLQAVRAYVQSEPITLKQG